MPISRFSAGDKRCRGVDTLLFDSLCILSSQHILQTTFPFAFLAHGFPLYKSSWNMLYSEYASNEGGCSSVSRAPCTPCSVFPVHTSCGFFPWMFRSRIESSAHVSLFAINQFFPLCLCVRLCICAHHSPLLITMDFYMNVKTLEIPICYNRKRTERQRESEERKAPIRSTKCHHKF